MIKLKDFNDKDAYVIEFDDYENALDFVEDMSFKFNKNIPVGKRTRLGVDNQGNEVKEIINYYSTIAIQHRTSRYVDDEIKGKRWKLVKDKMKQFLNMAKDDFLIHEDNVDPDVKPLYLEIIKDVIEEFLDDKWKKYDTSDGNVVEYNEAVSSKIKEIFPQKGDKKSLRLKKLKVIKDKLNRLKSEFNIFYDRVSTKDSIKDIVYLEGEKKVYVLFKKKLLQFLTETEINEVNDFYDFINYKDALLLRKEDIYQDDLGPSLN